MGLFSFVRDAGRKVGLFGGAEAAQRQADASTRAAANEHREDARGTNDAFARQLAATVTGLGLEVQDLDIAYTPFTATVRGRVRTSADAEKVVLTVGNTMGVAQVDDQLVVEHPEPPAVFHSVVPGDTLSKISLAQYGVIHAYDAIFEANRPMLQHPDEIFPGQVLRIPPIAPPVHTVAKGETLGGIAKHWFGDARRYVDLFEANRGVLSSPDVVEIGQQLTIPVKQPQARG